MIISLFSRETLCWYLMQQIEFAEEQLMFRAGTEMREWAKVLRRTS